MAHPSLQHRTTEEGAPIGAATLSTTVGQSSLGDVIFAGLQTR